MKAANGFVQLKEVETKGIQYGDTNLRVAEVVSLGMVPDVRIEPYPFKVGDQVLFDTNKSLKHSSFWYLQAKDILAYDGN